MSTEKVPKTMADKFAAMAALTDAFCEQHLKEEYRSMIHCVIAALARKRPSPLLKGKDNVWAAAAVHAIGRNNFLDDPTQSPHCKSKEIYGFFGIAESTGQNKSKEIRDLLNSGPLSPKWTLPSRLANNPMVWMLQVNGLMVDIRHQPIEIQEAAYRQGLILYIPGKAKPMTRISMDTLQSAITKLQAMDLRQKELLADEIFHHQPHLLGLVLVQQRLGVSLEKIDFLLTFLLTCFQAMKDSGLKWSTITEDEIERQMDRFVATVNFSKDLGSSLQNQSTRQYAEGHPELVLLAYAQAETDDWLKRINPEESDKNVIIAAMTLVNCIAYARLA